MFPIAALGVSVLGWWFMRRGTYLASFACSSGTIAFLMASVAAGLYPVMLPSSIDAANDLTIYNAASAEETLMVMFVIAVIGMPFVLLYTAGVYYFFRGKVRLDEHSY